MRIVSLVPHATELLFALGLGDQVVGVTHECDFPDEARTRRHVTIDRLPAGLDAGQIDAAVRSFTEKGEAIYSLDEQALKELQPDLIVTQALCPVCAVSAEDVEAMLLEEMRRRRGQEIERGVCLVGPHRDDLELTLGEGPAKGYASHGESWSLALALRLGGFELLRGEGSEPVLVLDDVFAELDVRRRRALARTAARAEQVLVTAAVDDDVPDDLQGARYVVDSGTVSEMAAVSRATGGGSGGPDA